MFASFCDVVVQDGGLRAIELPGTSCADTAPVLTGAGVGIRDAHMERLGIALIHRRSVERLNLSGSAPNTTKALFSRHCTDNTRLSRNGLRALSVVLSRFDSTRDNCN